MSQVSDSLSYSLGLLIGNNLKTEGFANIDPDVIGTAIQDVYNESSKMDMASAQTVVQAESQKLASAKKMKIKSEGEAFLAENAKREGVVTLESGVQYEVISEGDGAKPSANDHVTTHYHGMLIDGTVFDSSVQRGEPASFPVNGVIQGWQEILQLMPTGSKWKVYIPYDKAYGERGAGQDIPPFAALIFEIELINIK